MSHKQRYGRSAGEAYRSQLARWERKQDAARIPRPPKKKPAPSE